MNEEIIILIVKNIYLLGVLGHLLKALHVFWTEFLPSSPTIVDIFSFYIESIIYSLLSFFSLLFFPKEKRKYIKI
jgi:hypothetical protein